MSDTTVKLSTPVMILAVLILIGFTFVFYKMYVLAETEEAQWWERRMALYGTVEALAFTAAGYLFGKEVHREQAAKAERRADQKTAEVEAAKTQAAAANAKGHSLRHLIETKRQSAASGAEYESANGQRGGESVPRGHVAEIAEFAERLFPWEVSHA